MRIIMPLFLAFWIVPSVVGLHCQDPYSFKRGDEVRIYRRDLQRNLWDRYGPDAIGTVLTLTSDSVVLLSRDGATVGMPLGSIGGVEVNRGPQSNTLKGMTAGAVIGAGAGLVVGLIASFETQGCNTGLPLELSADCQGYVLPVLGRVGLGALAGGMIGAMVGSFVKTDRWEAYSFEQGAVRLIASRGRLGFAASVTF
jgi:hypothetical protein